jgi:hypothetical protein
MPCHIHAGGYVQCINDIILSMDCVLYILLRQQPTNQQPSFLSQASWGRLEMKPIGAKNRDKNKGEKRRKQRKGNKKTKQKKGGKTIKKLKHEKGDKG